MKKGSHHTEESKRKLSIAGLGRRHSVETKQKLSGLSKGRTYSKEVRKRWSESKMGAKNPMFGKHPSEETLNKFRARRHTVETKKKIGKHWLGSGNPNWGGGISTYKRKLWLNNQRRVRKIGNGGSHTQGEWETLKAQYNWTCPACKKPEPEITLSCDHITPLCRGGSDNIENIQPLCRSCNSKKHTKDTKYV